MLARDLRSGRLIAVPANHVFASPPGGYRLGSYAPTLAHRVGNVPGFGHYGAPPAQIIYDGLGHPLGLSFLTALPALAGRVAALLPQFATTASKIFPLLQSTGAMSQGQPAPMPAQDMMLPSMQASAAIADGIADAADRGAADARADAPTHAGIRATVDGAHSTAV